MYVKKTVSFFRLLIGFCGLRFREDLGLNSLDYMDLMVTIKRVFDIMPAPAEMNLVVTLGDFYAFIERKLSEPKRDE